MAQAGALLQQGRHQEAEQVLRLAVAAHPDNHAALHMLGVLAHARGDYPRAISLLGKAIALARNLAPYHGNLGHAYLMSEQFGEAAECYRRVLGLDPRSHLARFGLGMARLGQKDYAAAAAELEKVLKAEPAHVDALMNLGTARAELGQHDRARAHFERALALRPNSAAIHYKYGVALRLRGELASAYERLARAAVLDPNLADAYYQMGAVLHARNFLDEAAVTLEHAIKLKPDLVPALFELGQVRNQLQLLDEAAQCFERVAEINPHTRGLYRALARTRHLQGRCEEARALAAKALAAGDDPAECHVLIGAVWQTEGRFDEAVAAFRQALVANPYHGHAHLLLAMLSEPENPADQVRQLEGVRASARLDAEDVVALEFALAAAHEKRGDEDIAFAHYRSANDLRRTRYPHDDPGVHEFGDRLKAFFTRAFFAARSGSGSTSERPVFVVGMMRSGTTLTEQILASHHQVHGHGELDHIRQIVKIVARGAGGLTSYPDCLATLDPTLITHLAEEHVARLAHDAPDVLRSIDKQPQNFERLGVIGLLFPHARIIHCTRDPVDTCLSAYFHDFKSESRFTYDLQALGRYYRYYQRLMAHWSAVLPNPMLEVPYEHLVADPEGWSRKLVDFLGLPWDENCLQFHRNDRPVYTYSLWQVRQPIYRSSLQRWRKYARHLGPLFDGLELPRPESLTRNAPGTAM